MLAVPKQEFPEFPAALSHLLLLTPPELQDVLDQRLAALTTTLAGLETSLADDAAHGLPRIAMLESEYLRAVTAAEVQWLNAVADDLRTGRLPFAVEALLAFAENQG